jgi:hypothetical protein
MKPPKQKTWKNWTFQTLKRNLITITGRIVASTLVLVLLLSISTVIIPIIAIIIGVLFDVRSN